MEPTAIGYYLCIHPAFGSEGHWYLSSFDSRGIWKASTRCLSRSEALRERRKRRAYHIRLAKERCNRKLARIGNAFVSDFGKGAKRSTREETSKVTDCLCDHCATRIVNHFWYTCDICGADVCDQCSACIPAGIHDGQVRKVCFKCQRLGGGLQVLTSDVRGIVERLRREVTALQTNSQKLIDDIFNDIRCKATKPSE